MSIDHFLQIAEKFEIQIFDKHQNVKNVKQTHVRYTGTPKKHPYDDEKLIVIANPFGTNTTYYEFNLCDISYVEKLSNEVSVDGETITVAHLWVKKGSIGIHCTPFVADAIPAPSIQR